MNVLEYLLILLVLSFVLPVIVYVSAKLAAYGVLKGKRQFRIHHPEDKEKVNGQQT